MSNSPRPDLLKYTSGRRFVLDEQSKTGNLRVIPDRMVILRIGLGLPMR